MIIADHTEDDFVNFASKKVNDIHEDTSNAADSDIHHLSAVRLECFAPVRKDEVVKFLRESLSKT